MLVLDIGARDVGHARSQRRTRVMSEAMLPSIVSFSEGLGLNRYSMATALQPGRSG
jgi:hypothetical protein